MDNAVVTGWYFSGAYLTPTNSGYCPNGGYCTKIGDDTYMSRTFSIDKYSDIYLKFDIACRRYCFVYYQYNNHNNWILLWDVFANSRINKTTPSFSAPMGATSVTVRINTARVSGCSTCYSGSSSDGFIDNFYLFVTTAAPTSTPTFAPSASTFAPSSAPTNAPTHQPTNIPTTPSESPTSAPSDVPTAAPSAVPTTESTSPTQSPTHMPSSAPSAAPSVPPSDVPTDSPSLFPTNHPSVAPTDSPTVSPSFAPSGSPSIYPSNAPTGSPTYIYGFEYGSCLDLEEKIELQFDMTQSECINHCHSKTDCRMVNHYEYFKTASDARCYLFDKSCLLSHNPLSENPSSTLWFKSTLTSAHVIDSECMNYPHNWVDVAGDPCDLYTQFDWCAGGRVLEPYTINDISLLQDGIYGMDAVDVCCECSDHSGLFAFENITLFYNEHQFNETLLCDWPHQEFNHKQWRYWDNLVLYEWCIDAHQRFNIENDTPCIHMHFTDYEYSMEEMIPHNVTLCDFDLNEHSEYTDYYFMALFAYDGSFSSLNTYINAKWFTINANALSDKIKFHTVSFESCVSRIMETNTSIHDHIFGIYPCSAPNPTFNPTLYPTVNPSLKELTLESTASLKEISLEETEAFVESSTFVVIFVILSVILLCLVGVILMMMVTRNRNNIKDDDASKPPENEEGAETAPQAPEISEAPELQIELGNEKNKLVSMQKEPDNDVTLT
eukprot:295931_1